MSREEEDAWQEAWRTWNGLEVSFTVNEFRVNGDRAQLVVSGTYNPGNGDELDVNIVISMEKQRNNWVITSVR